MEHLTCLSPDDLFKFIEVTQMEVIAAVPERIILKGESIFTWVYDYSKEAYCFLKPKDS